MTIKKHKSKGKKYRKVRIEMSVEFNAPIGSAGDEKQQLETIAKIYLSSLGDKDIKIENISYLG